MATEQHKVFISYHHANDQEYKEALLRWNNANDIFVDASVDTGDISDDLSDESIRRKIRDEYLQDTTVTILLVGTETQKRKHVDWELYSSMYDGQVNKKSGVLVINLPEIGCAHFNAAHGDDEKRLLYPGISNWIFITDRSEYEDRYPYMPDRIIDNLLKPDVKISVANWDIATASPEKLRYLIEATFQDRSTCNYDLGQPMRRRNS